MVQDLSSGFGMRKHPIKGFSAMHKGVDFGAPTGTPIFAAGDGVLEKVGWINGYGRYILIRHNSTYKTAYAHMSGWAKGIRRGARSFPGTNNWIRWLNWKFYWTTSTL